MPLLAWRAQGSETSFIGFDRESDRVVVNISRTESYWRIHAYRWPNPDLNETILTHQRKRRFKDLDKAKRWVEDLYVAHRAAETLRHSV